MLTESAFKIVGVAGVIFAIGTQKEVGPEGH